MKENLEDILSVKNLFQLDKYKVEDLMGEIRQSGLFEDSKILDAIGKKCLEQESYISKISHRIDAAKMLFIGHYVNEYFVDVISKILK